MARYLDAKCRVCRRENTKLFLKGPRCDTPKCAFERRQSAPGMHAFRRGKMTDYAVHLREKQKVKHYYGVLERQFRMYFRLASRSKGNTGNTLLSLLERRLDNVVHRLGWGQSRAQARQIIRHGHILVNGRRVDIPSYLVRPGDVITVKNRKDSRELVSRSLSEHRGEVPDWLSFVPGEDFPGRSPEGHVMRIPGPEDVSIPVQPQLIVELCSR